MRFYDTLPVWRLRHWERDGQGPKKTPKKRTPHDDDDDDDDDDDFLKTGPWPDLARDSRPDACVLCLAHAPGLASLGPRSRPGPRTRFTINLNDLI